MVQICLKKSGTWWNSITMFQDTEYIKEIAHTRNDDSQIDCGFVYKQDLEYHNFAISKDYTYDTHTNYYHIKNAKDMEERGSYIFEWAE